jgi:hypothetical protein
LNPCESLQTQHGITSKRFSRELEREEHVGVPGELSQSLRITADT